MKEALIVMAILGCADDSNQCQTVQRVDAPFATVAACRAASGAVLAELTDLAYPVLVADCEESPKGALAAGSRPVRCRAQARGRWRGPLVAGLSRSEGARR